jgi:hypothetical protein
VVASDEKSYKCRSTCGATRSRQSGRCAAAAAARPARRQISGGTPGPGTTEATESSGNSGVINKQGDGEQLAPGHGPVMRGQMPELIEQGIMSRTWSVRRKMV